MRGTIVLVVLAAGLAGIIGLELTGIVADDGAMNPAPMRLPARPAAAAPVPGAVLQAGEGRRAWADAMTDAILARPLFSVDRRPASGPPSAVAAPAAMPRLAGVIMSGSSRTAIFAAADSGRPTVAAVGARIGDWTVQAIEAGGVTLSGPNGATVLRPSFDTSRAAPAPTTAAAPPGSPFAAAADVLPSLRGLPGFTGPAAR